MKKSVRNAAGVLAAAVVIPAAIGLQGSAASSVKINEKNFPDNVFRNYVAKYDLNNNKVLSEDEMKYFTELSLPDTVRNTPR